MSDKQKDIEKKKSNAEKPISLFGVKFEEVLGALLKTPKRKREDTHHREIEKITKEVLRDYKEAWEKLAKE